MKTPWLKSMQQHLCSPLLDSTRKHPSKKLIISNPFEEGFKILKLSIPNQLWSMEKVHNIITVRGIPLDFNWAYVGKFEPQVARSKVPIKNATHWHDNIGKWRANEQPVSL